MSSLLRLLLLGLLLSGRGDSPPEHPPEPPLTVPADVEAIMTAAYGDRWKTAVQRLAQDITQRTRQPFAPCTIVRRLVYQQSELYGSPLDVPCA